jgi:uncharacterized membrane protein HdeD (DUF308 family)
MKKYGWVIYIIGAALLFGLSVFLWFGDGESIIVPFLGSVIIISSCIRLVPYVRTQKNDLVKTINIMEVTIDIAIGAALILVTLFVDGGLKGMFGILVGVYLMLRGAVHFFGVSQGKEQSDLPIYIFHVAALIVGSYTCFTSNFTPAVLIHLILAFSLVSGGYLSYSGYKGYRSYRYQKTLYMPKSDEAKPSVEKEVPVVPQIEDEIEEPVQDQVVS